MIPGKKRDPVSEKVGFYQKLVWLLGLLLLLSVGWIAVDLFTNHHEARSIEYDAPHAFVIEEIIQPLRYSGLHDFMKSDARLSIDFENKKWRFQNIHQFDAQKNILLHQNRFGLCGDLSLYTYQKIKPLFGPEYEISFLRVAEAGYFQAGNGSHVILAILNKTLPIYHPDRLLFLDPSLKRYGRREVFDQYVVLEKYDPDAFLQSFNTFNSFAVGKGPPILITPKYMLSFNVRTVNGVLDPDNYRLAIFAAKRFGYLRPVLFLIEKKQGRVRMKDLEHPIRKDIDTKVYQKFKDRIIKLFHDLESRINKVSTT